MREIAKLKGRVYTKQIAIHVDEQTYQDLRRLKTEGRVDTAQEFRAVISEHIDRLKKAVGIK